MDYRAKIEIDVQDAFDEFDEKSRKNLLKAICQC